MFWGLLGLASLFIATWIAWGAFTFSLSLDDFTVKEFFSLVVAILGLYAFGGGMLIFWRHDQRNRLLHKLNTPSFKKGARKLSWYQRKILGRRVVAKIQSGEFLAPASQRGTQAEDALKDLENQLNS